MMFWTASPTQLQELMDRYVSLKRSLVQFTQDQHHDEILARASQHTDGKIPTQKDIIQATDAILRHDEFGPKAIDEFLLSNTELDGDDREMVRRWTDSVTGVFVTRERRGRVLRAHNLVDDLDYTIAMSVDLPEFWSSFDTGLHYFASIVPLAGGWTFSGMQQMLDHHDERYAHGIAAKLALSSPSSFFRNPAHLKQGLQAQERRHEAFVELFHRSWVEGSAAEIERMHRELLRAGCATEVSIGDADQRRRAEDVINSFELPRDLYEVDSVGMLSHPSWGLFFTAHFGTFLDAFELPEADLTEDHLETVMGYFEADSISPAVFENVAGTYPERATALFRRLLRRPDFQWDRDGDELLQKRKASHYPPLPSELRISRKLEEGQRWLQDQSQGLPPLAVEQAANRPIPTRRPKRKKKKQKGKTRRRSRKKKTRR